MSPTRSHRPNPPARTAPRSVTAPLTAAIFGVVAALVVPAPALAAGQQQAVGAAERLRTTDLGALERVLAERIQTALQRTISAVNETNRQVQRAAAAADDAQTVEIRYLFRTSGETAARGLYLQDYGVLFTVQVPRVSYNASPLVVGNAGGSVVVREDDADVAIELVNRVALEQRMWSLERGISELQEGLEAAQSENSDEAAALAASIQQQLGRLREMAAQLEVSARNAAVAGVQDDRDQAIQEQDASRAQAERNRARWSSVLVGPRVRLDPEAQLRAQQQAELDKVKIQSALLESVIDTLANHGHYLRGMQATDRLAVVIQPDSYLNAFERWLPATRRAEEFVVSVRFGDIEALSNGMITAQEFGEQVRVESRLGQPRDPLRQR